MYKSLDSDLRAGRVTTVINGKLFSVIDARRMVAYAQALGWLPPQAAWGDVAFETTRCSISLTALI